MKIFKIAQDIPRNIPVPVNKLPNNNTEFIFSERLEYTGGNSSKQYIVRVYSYPDGTFSVFAFNGRIGGGLTRQPKGMYRSEHSAILLANRVINSKIRGGYNRAPDDNQAPGVQGGASTVTPSSQQTSSPSPSSSTPSTPQDGDFKGVNEIIADLGRDDSVIDYRSKYMYKLDIETNKNEIPVFYVIKSLVSPPAVLRRWPIGARYKAEQYIVNQIMIDRDETAPFDVVPIDVKEMLSKESNLDELMTDEAASRKILEVMKDINFNILDEYPAIEEFIHQAINSSLVDSVLELPQGIFDRIRMTDTDRRIIEEHFSTQKAPEETFTPSVAEDLFASRKTFTKVAKEGHPDVDWYEKMTDKLENELSGYFKYSINSDDNEKGIYNIFWIGLGSKTRINKYDMPPYIFEEHKEEILSVARKDAERAYKEVMAAYMGGR